MPLLRGLARYALLLLAAITIARLLPPVVAGAAVAVFVAAYGRYRRRAKVAASGLDLVRELRGRTAEGRRVGLQAIEDPALRARVAAKLESDPLSIESDGTRVYRFPSTYHRVPRRLYWVRCVQASLFLIPAALVSALPSVWRVILLAPGLALLWSAWIWLRWETVFDFTVQLTATSVSWVHEDGRRFTVPLAAASCEWDEDGDLLVSKPGMRAPAEISHQLVGFDDLAERLQAAILSHRDS